jgi:hypothetical protein
MLGIIRSHRSGQNMSEARGRRPTDPLIKTIVMDLLVTTTGFLLMVGAVLLTVQSLSLN